MTIKPILIDILRILTEENKYISLKKLISKLDKFDKDDLKDLYDVRTYIAHDYEGVNLSIIEWIIRFGLPKFKTQCLKVIDKLP